MNGNNGNSGMENIENFQKMKRIGELINSIGGRNELIELDDFSKDYLNDLDEPALFTKCKKARAIFQLNQQTSNEFKMVIKALKLQVKIFDLGMSFDSENKLNFNSENVLFDIILEGRANDLWGLVVIWNGSWMEEYSAFRHDPENPNIESKWLPKKSWDQDKYIDPELKKDVKELVKLTGKYGGIHLPIHPYEMVFLRRKNIRINIIQYFRVDVYKSLQNGELRKTFTNTFDKIGFYEFITTINNLLKDDSRRLKVNEDGYIIPNDGVYNYYVSCSLSKNYRNLKWLDIYFELDKSFKGDRNVSNSGNENN